MAEGSLRRLAAVDIGTVTTRLLIADVRPPSIAEVVRSTDITHLGEGLTETGHLDPVAMERVASVIGRYSRELATAGAESVVAVTTSAARDASNGDDLLDLLESCGIRPEIISGQREAALSFAGATSGCVGTDLLVVDVGGGSTELVSGAASEGPGSVRSAQSLDIGSRRITEMFLASDPPTRDELAAARRFIMTAIAPAIIDLQSPPAQMISVAGTATTLSAIRLGLEEYDPELIHGSVLTIDDLAELLGVLASMRLAKREAVTGLAPGRAPVIVAGTLILSCVLEESGLGKTAISDHDILYGILLDTYASQERAG